LVADEFNRKSGFNAVDDPHRVGTHRPYRIQHDFDSVGKLMPLSGVLLEEFHRLGESEDKALYYGLLQFSCGLLYVIPRTSILGAILVTGFLGGAEAIQTRVSGSGALLNTLPLLEIMIAWGGIWLRDERLRNLIPLCAPRAASRTEARSL
jgi:hypothetical protein